MTAYYNEHDPQAAAWLRELIKAGLIAPGEVDETDIQKIGSRDLAGYTQVHLFAGIGGWSYALRLAGWPDDRPVWTGSCPCQPFSAAGKQKGTKDARHLWPWMRHLMFCWRPAIAFGEQVASRLGREWLSGVRANVETLGYVFGTADLCAAGVKAPHIRQRLFWVADAEHPEPRLRKSHLQNESRVGRSRFADGGTISRLADPTSGRFGIDRGASWSGGHIDERGAPVRLGHSIQPRLEGHAGHGDNGRESGRIDSGADRPIATAGAVGGLAVTDGRQSGNGRLQPGREYGQQPQGGGFGFWSAYDLIPCRDEKSRRVEPGSFPLAHGVPHRVGLLRGYGNAIVAQLAAQFIKAYCET